MSRPDSMTHSLLSKFRLLHRSLIGCFLPFVIHRFGWSCSGLLGSYEQPSWRMVLSTKIIESSAFPRVKNSSLLAKRLRRVGICNIRYPNRTPLG